MYITVFHIGCRNFGKRHCDSFFPSFFIGILITPPSSFGNCLHGGHSWHVLSKYSSIRPFFFFGNGLDAGFGELIQEEENTICQKKKNTQQQYQPY